MANENFESDFKLGDTFVGRWDHGDEGPLNNPAYAFEGLKKTARDFQERAEEVRGDSHLSEEGAQAKIQQLARTEAREAIEQWDRKAIRPLREKIGTVRRDLQPYESLDPGDQVSATRERMILEHFQDLEPTERSKLLRDRAREGDEMTVRAVLETPEFVSGVSADTRQSVRRDMIEQRHPDEVEQLATLEDALQDVERAREAAVEVVAKEAGLDPELVEQPPEAEAA